MDKTAEIALIVLCVIAAMAVVAILLISPAVVPSHGPPNISNLSNLPDSFTLNIYLPKASSGGSSKDNMSLDFRDGVVSGGWYRAESWNDYGHFVDECLLNPVTLKWSEKNIELNPGESHFPALCEKWVGPPPRTKDGIKKWIDDMEALPLAECGSHHNAICYWFS